MKSLRSPEHKRLMKLLRAERKKAGLTQVALATRLGQKQNFVSRYETGERRVDVVEFISISRVLKFDAARAVRDIGAKYDPN